MLKKIVMQYATFPWPENQNLLRIDKNSVQRFARFCSHYDANEIEDLLSASDGNVRDVLQTFIDVLIVVVVDLEQGISAYSPVFDT